MPFNFHFSAQETIWTLTFAAILVLLVVLLGRDRLRRFPWFTSSLVMVGLRMLAGRMLYGKMAPLKFSQMSLVLADAASLVSLLVLIELARRAFAGASRRSWIVGTLVVLAVGGTIVGFWGPWPAWKTLAAGSTMADLRLMQMAAQKGDLLVDLAAIQLGLLVAFAGRRFRAGWRSHTQQILIGLSTAAIAQMVIRVWWQAISQSGPPRSQAEYDQITGLQSQLLNFNSVVYLVVLFWWIACLWIDEPGSDSVKSLPAETPEEGPAS